MKLRNKKTGEIIEGLISAYGISGDVAVSVRDSDVESGYTDLGRYKTLAELNEEWEDYTPTEPLIKDEKVCNLIRAWADFTNNNKLTIRVDKEDDDTFCDYNFLINKHLFMRFFMRRVDGLESGEYDITELCGEEE